MQLCLMACSFSGVQIYRKFYTEEKERSSGVLAIGVSKATIQLYISMASMLSVSVILVLLLYIRNNL